MHIDELIPKRPFTAALHQFVRALARRQFCARPLARCFATLRRTRPGEVVVIPFTIRLALGISVLAFMSPVVVGPFASAVQATTYSWDGGGGANSNFNNAT